MQAWNQRVASLLPGVSAISQKIELRTEFTGAGTAEHAMQASAELYNQQQGANGKKIEIQVKSAGDWFAAARRVVGQNHPEACRFGDIMSLAPEDLRKKLQEPITDKAGRCYMFFHHFIWHFNHSIVLCRFH